MIHEREFFYKYVTAETALLILKNQKLKYSSPIIFNDPFDTQTGIGFDFTESEFADALHEEIYRLVHDEKEPVGDDSHATFKGIKRLWHRIRTIDKKMPRELYQQNKERKLETIRNVNRHIEDINSWWKLFVKASRVFCLAEENDNLLMWAHYAKDHTGAVIKFKCFPGTDTQLCDARRVNYVENPPIIAEMEEFLRFNLGQGHLRSVKEILDSLILSKSNHWMYEKEWRVFKPPDDSENIIIPKDNNGKELLSDLVPFYPKEIHSIYFGCKMSYENIHNIVECLADDFAHVKKYKSIRHEKRYKLDFEEINQ